MIALIGSLGIAQVDLLGTSFGGFVAQDIVRQAPQCVRKLILASSGPAGGAEIDKVDAVSLPQILKGALTRRDPKYFLFFTASQRGRHAATAFLGRLAERTQHRDKPLSPARSGGNCRRSRHGRGNPRKTSPASPCRCSSPPAITTAWCRPCTAKRWPGAFATRS